MFNYFVTGKSSLCRFMFKNYVGMFARAQNKIISVVSDSEEYRGSEALELFFNTAENNFVVIFHVVLAAELENLRSHHS